MSIRVVPNPVTLVPGATQQFTASGTDVGGNVFALSDVVWSTSRGTINENTGVFITPSVPGGTRITITATKGSINGTAEVTVSEIKSINVTETSIDYGTIQVGKDSSPQTVNVLNDGNLQETISATSSDMTLKGGGSTIPSNNVVITHSNQTINAAETDVVSLTLHVPAVVIGTYTGTVNIVAN